MHATNGASAYGASGKYNSAAVGQTANGNKYATANGDTYKNTGSGWQNTNGSSNKYSGSSSNSAASKGWGGRKKAADHPLSAAAATEAGAPGRRALVGRQAWAVVVAGEAAVVVGEASKAAANEVNVGERCWCNFLHPSLGG
jgi:hypothetical protein